MPDKLQKMHLIICVSAAVLVALISILKQISLYQMAMWVSITIVVFYFIGQMVRLFLLNWLIPTEEAPEEADEEAAETDENLDGEAADGDEDMEDYDETTAEAADGSRITEAYGLEDE